MVAVDGPQRWGRRPASPVESGGRGSSPHPRPRVQPWVFGLDVNRPMRACGTMNNLRYKNMRAKSCTLGVSSTQEKKLPCDFEMIFFCTRVRMCVNVVCARRCVHVCACMCVCCVHVCMCIRVCMWASGWVNIFVVLLLWTCAKNAAFTPSFALHPGPALGVPGLLGGSQCTGGVPQCGPQLVANGGRRQAGFGYSDHRNQCIKILAQNWKI